MKKAFLLKNNWIEIFDNLSDKQAGVLIKSLFKYNVNGEKPTDLTDIEVKAYFNVMLLDCNAMNESYDRRCETSALNGSLGGAPKGNSNAKKQPKNNLNNLNNPNENENDNENDLKKEAILTDSQEKKIKKQILSFEENKNKFMSECADFIPKYGKELIRAFFDYWTEPNKSRNKMRFELQKTWDLALRLSTWNNNNLKFNKNGTNQTTNTTSSRKTTPEQLASAIADGFARAEYDKAKREGRIVG